MWPPWRLWLLILALLLVTACTSRAKQGGDRRIYDTWSNDQWDLDPARTEPAAFRVGSSTPSIPPLTRMPTLSGPLLSWPRSMV